jgi:hypothetical protein
MVDSVLHSTEPANYQQRTDCHMMMMIKLRTDASMFSHEQQYQSNIKADS